MTDLPTPADNLAAAELRSQRARDQLQLTLAQLQERLDPRARVKKATREARVAGEAAVAIAQDNPAVTGGIVAGTLLAAGAFLGRQRIARLFVRPRPDIPPTTAGLAPVTRTKP